MKKKAKITLVVAILIILIGVGIALYNFLPMLQMTPASTGAVQGTKVIAVHNGRGAAYLVEAEDGYLMIDTGTNASNNLFAGDAFRYSQGDPRTNPYKLVVPPFTMGNRSAGESISMLQSMVYSNTYHVFTSHYGYFECGPIE